MNGKSKKQETKAKGNWFGELRAYSRNPAREIGREFLRGPSDLRYASMRLLEKYPSEKDLILEIVPDARTLNKILTTPSNRMIVVSEIEKYVTEELSHRLSQKDFEIFQQHRLEPPDDTALARICTAMDDVILEAAVQQGPIIFLMREIHQRVTDWTLDGDNGARRWKRLGEKFAQFTLVTQGGKSSLGGLWARSRTTLIQEVKELQKSLQARFRGGHDLPADWGLHQAATDTVEGEPATFPKLLQIDAPFQLFLSAKPESLRNLIAGYLTPALFTDELIGWNTNYEPGSVPQIIRRHS
jgi:hypothetical protein